MFFMVLTKLTLVCRMLLSDPSTIVIANASESCSKRRVVNTWSSRVLNKSLIYWFKAHIPVAFLFAWKLAKTWLSCFNNRFMLLARDYIILRSVHPLVSSRINLAAC